jgi:hypothetical protein
VSSPDKICGVSTLNRINHFIAHARCAHSRPILLGEAANVGFWSVDRSRQIFGSAAAPWRLGVRSMGLVLRTNARSPGQSSGIFLNSLSMRRCLSTPLSVLSKTDSSFYRHIPRLLFSDCRIYRERTCFLPLIFHPWLAELGARSELRTLNYSLRKCRCHGAKPFSSHALQNLPAPPRVKQPNSVATPRSTAQSPTYPRARIASRLNATEEL